MRKNVVLVFLFVLMFSCIFCFLPGTAMADNEGRVRRSEDSNHTFLSVRFTVSSNAHSTGTVYRTTGLKIWIGPYYAFFDQAYLTSKGFYSSSSSDSVDFTAADIANRSGASVAQIRAAANDISNGINLGAQIKVLQNGVVKATIEEKAQVAPVFNQYGLGSCIAAAETRWGWAYDPYKPISYTLTMQIEGQGSTTPVGSQAPGTVYNNMSGTVQLSALPVGGWKFVYWYDVLAGNSIATTPQHNITMNKNQTIRAVFIPDAATPPAVTPTPPEPPAPEPPPPPPPPPDYDPIADFDISNPTPVEGQTIQLRDNSSHPGAANGEEIVSYKWTIQSGTPATSTERNVNVNWAEVGTYKITLRVEDQDGDSDSCTKSVVVGPALPAAVITISSDSIMIGREFHVDGDESTAAMERDIKWDEMEWKIYGPDGSLKRDYVGRYPLGKGTSNERTLTNSVLNQTGSWKVRLKVKDTNDNESEWTERIFTVYPDQPPVADFWLVSETLRNSYQGNVITVHDQSHPAAPDGALGDEIFQRTWCLYYDANNTGVFVVAGADSATLTTTSGNDQYPKIRFKKTGRYKLELAVRERAVVWGVMTNGLTGNTSGKALEEKQVVVINLAPATAFEIKKKMPVDVQFAADYTVSDSKYNSLQSSQAGFIAALEAGGIDPVTGVQKVTAGDTAEKYNVVNPFTTTGEIQRIEPIISPDWYFIDEKQAFVNPVWGWTKPHAFNVATGQKADYFTVYELNDGTYYQTYYTPNYGNPEWRLDSVAHITADRNIITARATYDSLITSVIPADAHGWKYIFQRIILAPNGSIFVWYKAEKPSGNWIECKQYLQKINYNRTLGWNKNFMTYSRRTDSAEIPVTLEHSFSDYEHFLFLRTDPINYANYWDYIVMVGPSGFNNIYSYQYPINAHGSSLFGTLKCYGAANNNLAIITGLNWFKVVNTSGIMASQEVPININNDVAGWQHGEGAALVAPYTGNQTAVLFSCAQFSPGYGQDYAYLYTITNSTGAITLRNTYTDLWPGNLPPTSSWATKFQMTAQCVNDSIIGVKAEFINNVDDGPSDIYYSVIKSDFSIAWTTAKYTSYFRPNQWSPKYEPSIKRVNDNLVDYIMGVTSNQYTENHKIYGSNGTSLLASGENGIILDSGAFILQSSRSNKYYNSAGALVWQKSTSDGDIASGTLFNNGIVVKAVVSGKPAVKILNSANGNTVINIAHEYLWSDGGNLLCYGIKADGTRDGAIRSFSQKQGLQYLSQVISSHSWDNQKSNFAVSIIDSDKYKDYSTKRDSVISQLKTNHLKLAVISPAAGQTKTQANELIQNSEGGWWIQTAASMPGPLSDLAQKIITQVNQERGADNIVLVNQKVELTGNYSDPETDPAGTMRWEFSHDPYKLGSYSLCNSMGVSYLHGAKVSIPPTSFDKVGTFQVRYRAKDIPVTNAAYLNDPKSGAKWSSMDAYLTVLVHRRPIAAFTLSSTTINKTGSLVITDNSYDPDLVNTDPEGKKGLRNWEWQYRNTTTGEEWKSSLIIPSSFTTKGVYAIRLRVRDAHGAWSDWTDQKLFTVLNNKPIAVFDALPNPVFVNNPCSLIDSSYDPDGDPLASWEWTIQGIGTLNKVSAVPFPVSWPNAGDYLVTLRVRDTEGVWSDPVSQTVKVINYFMLTLESMSIQNGRGTATATPGGNPPGPSGTDRVNAPVFPVNINSNEIGAYSLNQQVTLTASPITSGTYFLEWRDGDEVISRNATCTIRMTGNRTITAVFMKDPIFVPAVPPKTHVYIVK